MRGALELSCVETVRAYVARRFRGRGYERDVAVSVSPFIFSRFGYDKHPVEYAVVVDDVLAWLADPDEFGRLYAADAEDLEGILDEAMEMAVECKPRMSAKDAKSFRRCILSEGVKAAYDLISANSLSLLYAAKAEEDERRRRGYALRYL